MQELLMLLQQQGIETVSLEVIRDNHAAVALYQSLGFTRRYGLCGYLSSASGCGIGRITALSHPGPATARH
jgi:ribosomal protein S18 acetylase RimI-like enzyme